MQHARDRIRELTERRRVLLGVEVIVEDVNRFLQGWGAYFKCGNSARYFDMTRSSPPTMVTPEVSPGTVADTHGPYCAFLVTVTSWGVWVSGGEERQRDGLGFGSVLDMIIRFLDLSGRSG